MKRVKLLALALALAVTFSSVGARETREPADALVFDAISAPASVSYTGVVESIRIGTEGSDVSVYRIEHLAPALTGHFYTTPASLHGDEVITQGKRGYWVDARRRRIVQSSNGAVNDEIAFADNYILMRANYEAVEQPDESFDGRSVDVVALLNKYTHRSTLLLRIDRQTKLVLDKQEYGPDGALVDEVRFESVRYTANIASSDFSLPKTFSRVDGPRFAQPSDDVNRVLRSAGFNTRDPKFLPEGFSPVEGKLVAIQGVRTVHLLYSDGIRTVSLFENATASGLEMTRMHPQATTVSGRPAQYAENGETTLLAWSGPGLHFVLVGELSLGELQRIAASI